MGCTFNNLDFSIFKDKVIIIAFILILILSVVLIFMIRADDTVQTSTVGQNHSKIIKKWTLTPIDGKCINSGFGGDGPNGSINGFCYYCNCTSISDY